MNTQKVHWVAPTTMLGGLLAGVMLAIGHDQFYQRLVNKGTVSGMIKIGSSTMELSISNQKFNTTIGTLFGFMIKSCLALAVSTIYVQIYRGVIKKQSTPIGTIDTLSSATQDVLNLLCAPVWYKYPLLFLLALTVRLLPIASVFTPATLTTIIVPRFRHYSTAIPTVDFRAGNFYYLPTESRSGSILDELPGDSVTGFEHSCGGPHYFLKRVAISTAAQGTISSIPAPATNSSWDKPFFGPAITCSNIPDPLWSAILLNVAQTVNTTGRGVSYGYLSWPWIGAGTVPFQDGTLVGKQQYEASRNYYQPYSASLIVAAFPNLMVDTQMVHSEDTGDDCAGMYQQAGTKGATALECWLYNASYQTKFSYNNGMQHLDINTSLLELVNVQGNVFDLNNTTYTFNINGSGTDPYPVEILAYQSIFHAFEELLYGSIASSLDILGALRVTETSVLVTSLANTIELAHLESFKTHNDTSSWLTNTNSANQTSESVKHLGPALEELFRNMTMSLMGSSRFTINNLSDPRTIANITETSYVQVYEYSRSTLLIAYGSAVLVATIAVVIGFATIYHSRETYSNTFSTVTRTVRHAELTEPINAEDATGQDPLPNYIAKSRVIFSDQIRQRRKVVQLSPRQSVCEEPSAHRNKAQYFELVDRSEE